MARGLGLRKIVCILLQTWASPFCLVLLVGATPADEAGMGEELSVMGYRDPGLRLVTFEMDRAER